MEHSSEETKDVHRWKYLNQKDSTVWEKRSSISCFMAGDINWVLHEPKQRDEENPRLSSQLGVRSRPELHGAPFCTETQQKQYLDDIKSLFFKTQSLKRLSILKSKALSLPSSSHGSDMGWSCDSWQGHLPNPPPSRSLSLTAVGFLYSSLALP